MLAEILVPISTKQGTLKPGQLVDLSQVAIQRLEGKVRLIVAEQTTVAPEPHWQRDFCEACGDFNRWLGCCPLSIDDCLLSRVLDSGGNIAKLRGFEIGHDITTDMVIDEWLDGGEPAADIFKNPTCLILMAEHLLT